MTELTENSIVNLPASVPIYVKRALYDRVKEGKRSEFITNALKKELGIK